MYAMTYSHKMSMSLVQELDIRHTNLSLDITQMSNLSSSLSHPLGACLESHIRLNTGFIDFMAIFYDRPLSFFKVSS